MAQNIIELVDLTKKYGSHLAVDKLSLTIKRVKCLASLAQMARENRQQSS